MFRTLPILALLLFPLIGTSTSLKIYLTKNDFIDENFAEYELKSTSVSNSSITFKLADGEKLKYDLAEIWGFILDNTCIYRTLEYSGEIYLFKAGIHGKYMLWSPYNHHFIAKGPTLDIERDAPNPARPHMTEGVTGDFFRFDKATFEKHFKTLYPAYNKIRPFLEEQNGDSYKETFDCKL
jgi:hypothetical protein